MTGAEGQPGTDGQDGVNGTDGQDGVNGTDGQNGINGQDGADGSDGTDGADGDNGLASLITSSIEPSGVNCPTGGTRIDTGVDSDRNGQLTLNEIDATVFVCDGSDGVDGADGVDGRPRRGGGRLLRQVPAAQRGAPARRPDVGRAVGHEARAAHRRLAARGPPLASMRMGDQRHIGGAQFVRGALIQHRTQ